MSTTRPPLAALCVLLGAGCAERERPAPQPPAENLIDPQGVLRGLGSAQGLEPLQGELVVEHGGQAHAQGEATRTSSDAWPPSWRGAAATDPTSSVTRGALGPLDFWQETSAFGSGLPGARLVYTLRARAPLPLGPRVYFRLRVPVPAGGPALALDGLELAGSPDRSPRLLARASHVQRVAFAGERERWEILPTRPLDQVEARLTPGAGGAQLELLLTLSTRPLVADGSVSTSLRLRRAATLSTPVDPRAAALLASTWAASATAAASAHARALQAWAEAREPLRYQAEQRRRLLELLGLDPLPERPPIAAQRLGTLDHQGAQIERLRFESRPSFPVAASFYLPAGSTAGAKVGVVIIPSGHYTEGKAHADTQRLALNLARLGLAALALDTIGTGERIDEGSAHGWGLAGAAAGGSLAGYGVWDVLRAVDYLATRQDVDPARIGVSGVSGGGMLSLLAAAVDPRLRAAAPAAWPSALGDLFAVERNYCDCNYLPGLAASFDTADLLGLIAPRAVLSLASEQDLDVPVHGAWRAAQEARPIFERLGAPDALRITACPGGHAFTRPLREATYGFMLAALLGRGSGAPVRELEVSPLAIEALQVGLEGLPPEQRQSFRALLWAEARRAAGARRLLPPGARRTALAKAVGWVRAGAAVGAGLDQPGGEPRPHTRDGGELHAVSGAERGKDRPLVVLLGREPAEERASSALAGALEDAGAEVLAVELRGTGRSTPPPYARLFVPGVALVAGAPLATLRARELVGLLERLRPRGQPLIVVSTTAELSLAALLALALAEHPARGAALAGLPDSLADLLAPGASTELAEMALPGVLRAADVGELIDLAGIPVLRSAADAAQLLGSPSMP